MKITLINIAAYTALLVVGTLSINGTTQTNSLLDENITHEINTTQDVPSQDNRFLGCPDLAVFSNTAFVIEFNCSNPFDSSSGNNLGGVLIDLDGDHNPELISRTAYFERIHDPCCGDPCCGDPCCADPCGCDPCCWDPCCWDPDCFGYLNQDDHIPGAGIYDPETNTFENPEAASAWAYEQAIANGMIDKDALRNNEKITEATGCWDEYNVTAIGNYVSEEIGSLDTFQILNLDPSVMSYEIPPQGTSFKLELVGFFDMTRDGLPDAIVQLSGGGNTYFYIENISEPPAVACATDINNDGSTNVDDLLALVGNWGPCE